jgi:hypothetical protein
MAGADRRRSGAGGDPASFWSGMRRQGRCRGLPPRPPNAARGQPAGLRGRYTRHDLRGAGGLPAGVRAFAERCRAWPAAGWPRSPACRPNSSRRREPDRRASAPVLLHLDRHLPAHQRHPDRPRHRRALRPDRLPGRPRRQRLVHKPPLADIAGFDWVDGPRNGRGPWASRASPGPPRRGWITSRDLFRAIAEETLPGVLPDLLRQQLPAVQAQYPPDRGGAGKAGFLRPGRTPRDPSARHADLLLPVCTAWEREGLQAGFQVGAAAEAHVQLRPAFVPPRGESRSDTWIVFELAKRLGLAEQFFGGDPRRDWPMCWPRPA